MTMKNGIPLISKLGFREQILLLQQIRSPIFQIWVIYLGSNDFSTDNHTAHPDAISF